MADHTIGPHTWPEQDAIDAWVMEHPEVFGNEVPPTHQVLHDLKKAVTAYRIKVQDELHRSEQERAIIGGYNLWLRRRIWAGVSMAFAAGAGAMWLLLQWVG